MHPTLAWWDVCRWQIWTRRSCWLPSGQFQGLELHAFFSPRTCLIHWRA